MRWFWQKKPQELMRQVDYDQWITVPYRYVEATRLSIYTIAENTAIPVEVRDWIAQWLYGFNTELAAYMQYHYGPNIFPLLAKITSEVWPNGHGDVDQETWTKWEQELRGGCSE